MTTNLDPTEIDKFDSIANEWWDPKGRFKPLHAINPLRLTFIKQHAKLRNKNVIDVGCGGGILAESMARLGATVSGIDMAEATLAIAQKHAQLSDLKIDYQRTSAEEFAGQHTQQYDVVTCMELLEHVPDPASIVASCAQLVKPKGLLFFSTLNRNLKAYLLAIVGAEYLLKLLPKGTHQYDKFIQPAELDKWARQNQLTTKAIQGMGYNPVIKEYYLTDNIDVNYLICYQKTAD